MIGPGSVMAGLRRRPVRTRLAIFSGALTCVILIGFAAVVGSLVSNRLQAEFRDEIRDTAATLSVNIAIVSGADGLPEYAGPNLEELAMTNDAAIRIVDEYGTVRFSSEEAPPLGQPGDGGVRTGPGNLRVVDRPLPLNNALTGPLFIQYARSPTSVDATVGRLWLFLAGGVIVGTLLAGFAGMTLARRAMEPISTLTGTARTIARTRDPSLRIPEVESDDEVAELARTLDEMLRELDAARTETETTVRRQREFVADASHELRTPLTSILANLELLEESLEGAGADERAAARSALRSSKRMSRLVADLLILARADAGRLGGHADCDLSTIACEAFEEVRPVADGRVLTADIAPGAQLSGSADELHRMILNLLENAIRHTPEGSTIGLTLTRQGEAAIIEVADDGTGLPEGLEEQAFERFVRGAGPADRNHADGDGSGLGLSIVRAVATAHGGEVSAGRSDAGGARFTITLPLSGGESGPPGPDRAETEEAEPAPVQQQD